MIRLESVGYAPPHLRGEPDPPALVGPLDFSADPGTSHLLLGRNGSGKTTLIRILSGLIPPSTGRYLLAGEEIRVGPEGRSLWPDVAVLFEEPDPQFLTDQVEAEVAFGLESLDLPPEDVRRETGEALARFGIERLAGRAPQSLSAGEKALTLLAAAAAAGPRCLILDQALSHLDPGTRRGLEERIVREALAGDAIVIRTHQEPDPPYAGEILHVLEGGSLRAASQLTPKAVLDASRVPFPLALRVSALLALEGRWSGPLAADAGQVEAALGAIDEGKRVPLAWPGVLGAGNTASTSLDAAGPVALAMTAVSWSPAREAPDAIGWFDLEVARGEVVALIGRSGSGKTTVLKLAAGLVTPRSGTVHRETPSVPRVRPVALALEYPERQLFGRTVLEDVSALLWVDGVPSDERDRSARRALEEVGLDPVAFGERFPVSLSEGEKRRAALAGVLVEPPHVLLLDEPTAGLDPEGRKTLIAALHTLRERGRTILLASHDLDFVGAVADRIVLLARDESGAGRAIAQGPAREILRDRSLLERAGVPEPDFIRLERALRGAGLLAGSAVRDPESLLDAVARGLGTVQAER